MQAVGRGSRSAAGRGRPRVTPSAAARPVRHPEGPALPIFALLSSFKNEDYKRPASQARYDDEMS